MGIPRKLWEHPNPKGTEMFRFMQEINRVRELQLQSYKDLFAYSIAHRAAFWEQLFKFMPIIHTGSLVGPAVDEAAPISAVPRWFPGIRLNFAENILKSAKTGVKSDGEIAVTEVREGAQEPPRHVTWKELRERTGILATTLKARGLKKGDRVVLVGANSVETLLVMLATTWLGGIFSSSSTDMGAQGILQRSVQVDPKFLFMDDSALYNGKTIDLRTKMAEVIDGLAKGCPSFKACIAIPRFEQPKDIDLAKAAETWTSFLSQTGTNDTTPPFEQLEFHEPFLVCYSSGTTGIPKAIVHSVGGIILSYFKEGILHEGSSPQDVTLQYTTTGWVMYLANVGQLFVGARVVMYDGSPFVPDSTILLQIVESEKVTKLGISPRWLFELTKLPKPPREIANLSSLRIVTSTGMVLSEALFEWFYDQGFPNHVWLANISGGTDIAGCFGLQNPLTPVYVGGTQGPSLGVQVEIWDASTSLGEAGRVVPNGEPGELVAVSAFPNVPVFLWNDGYPNPEHPQFHPTRKGSTFHKAYFARFAQKVWAHGDFCVVHPITGNISFLGRADGVLNPSGVRFGSAEIYSVIERNFSDEVADSLCVGQRRPNDQDERVMLFLLMRPGHRFSPELVGEVKEKIAKECSKRHVPAFVFETKEIPTTVNLKKVELPVKQIVSGQRIKPSGTLLNPKSLEFYYQFAEVENLIEPKSKL